MCSFQTETNTTYSQPLFKVTFDTNTLSGVVGPDQQAGAVDQEAYRMVHNALKTGLIRGFFSEAVITLDAIGKKDKAAVLGATRFVSETISTAPNQVTIKFGPCWKRIDIDPRIRTRIEAALSIGIRALIGPRRFGDSPVVQGYGNDFYEAYPSGSAFETAVDATNTVDMAIVARGLGRARVIELAKSFSERDGATGELWLQGLERTRSNAETKAVRLAVNEWADGEALAAHVGYNNDLFCTNDQGGDLAEGSVLHPQHRSWLRESYGVNFVNITEMAALLTL